MSAASGFNDDFLDMLRALVDSGADLAAQGIVYQLGLPPRRIDLMTSLSGVDFDDAWSTRVELEIDGMPIPFLGLEALRRNKQATGRDRDLLDLRLLDGTESEK